VSMTGSPSLYEFAKQFAALTIPTVIMVGDEDDACLEPSVFLKRTIATAGLFVQPRTGHAINLEEPAVFNREVQEFLSTVARTLGPARSAGRGERTTPALRRWTPKGRWCKSWIEGERGDART